MNKDLEDLGAGSFQVQKWPGDLRARGTGAKYAKRRDLTREQGEALRSNYGGEQRHRVAQPLLRGERLGNRARVVNVRGVGYRLDNLDAPLGSRLEKVSHDSGTPARVRIGYDVTTMPKEATPPPVTRREILGWCMYDVADSAFTTVIVTTLYALYYGTVVVGDTQRADFLWGLGASISEVIVAVLAPILGAIADYSGSRKKFLAVCAATIVFFTASLWFVGPGMAALGLGLYILANIGFAGGGVFIDSFLPGISNEQNAGRISGLKWAIGYSSGLVALFLCLQLGFAENIKPNPTPSSSRGRG